MPAVRTTSRLFATGASLALIASGLVASPAHAASFSLSPGSPAAGAPFTVTVGSLDNTKSYRVLLTGTSQNDNTDVAEANSCASFTRPTNGSLTCTLTENTAGAYKASLYEETAGLQERSDVIVDKSVSITPANAPQIIDNNGVANDAIKFTYTEGIVWSYQIDSGTETTVDFGTNPVAPTKEIAVDRASGDVDVTVKATSATGFSIAGGDPTFVFRLTGANPAPAPLAVTSAQAPVAVDPIGLKDDKATITRLEGVDWFIVNGSDETAVNFGGAAIGSSVTVGVTPTLNPATGKHEVTIMARAADGRAFSNGRLAEQFTLSYTDAAAPATFDRVGGKDRFATAVGISRQYFADGADTVYVVNGLRQADALAAGPAAARDGAPLLLSMAGEVPAEVLAEITRLKPKAIKLVGGESVLEPAVAARLGSIAPITRLAGPNRNATAAEVAKNWSAPGVIYIANGSNDAWPDAISGGSAGAKSNAPLLLAHEATLSDETTAALARTSAGSVRLVGGTDRLNDRLITQIKAVLPNATVTRYVGRDVSGPDNRYGTNSSVISRETGVKANPTADPAVAGSEHVFFATGRNWPDALAGVPAAAKLNAPLALVDTTCIPAVTSGVLNTLPVKRVTQLGQSSVLDVASLAATCTW